MSSFYAESLKQEKLKEAKKFESYKKPARIKDFELVEKLNKVTETLRNLKFHPTETVAIRFFLLKMKAPY